MSDKEVKKHQNGGKKSSAELSKSMCKPQREEHFGHIFEGLLNGGGSSNDDKKPKKVADINDLSKRLGIEPDGDSNCKLNKDLKHLEDATNLDPLGKFSEEENRILSDDLNGFTNRFSSIQSNVDRLLGVSKSPLYYQSFIDAVSGFTDNAPAYKSALDLGVIASGLTMDINGFFEVDRLGILEIHENLGFNKSIAKQIKSLVNPDWPQNELFASLYKSMGRTYEWEGDQLKEVRREPDPHRDYELIRANIDPQMTIREISIVKYPYSDSKRKAFARYLILLVGRNLLGNRGNFINRDKPKYLLIHREDYVNCPQLDSRKEHAIEGWIDKPSQIKLPAPKESLRVPTSTRISVGHDTIVSVIAKLEKQKPEKKITKKCVWKFMHISTLHGVVIINSKMLEIEGKLQDYDAFRHRKAVSHLPSS